MLKKILITLIIFILFIFVVVFSIPKSLDKEIQQGGGVSLIEPSIGLEAPMPGSAPGKDSVRFSENNFDTDRLVIKNGNLDIVVRDISDSISKIIEFTKQKEGFVVYSNVSEFEEIPSGNILVKVPSSEFDSTMSYFKDLAEKVDLEGSNDQDVTEEYTDLQSQLKNLEATEAQLLKIMERAQKIEDVLAVQRELTVVRGQIEGLKGRVQYLERNVDYASISVNLSLAKDLTPVPPAEKWRPLYILKQAWRSVLVVAGEMSYILIWILVYVAVLIPLIFIFWQLIKLFNRKK